MKQSELQRLLAHGEREDVDFKRDPSGVSADDLVAFANSGKRGIILIGVSEATDSSGRQIGVPCGCPMDDGTKLLLTNKAQSCHPPVRIEMEAIRDSASSNGLLALHIPASEARPHCTPKGAYLTRHGTRNVPVLPQQLLAIFLENESNLFASRFTDATEEMSEHLGATLGEVQALKTDVSSRIEQISSQMMLSDMTLDDTESLLRTLIRETKDLEQRVGDAGSRMRQLIEDTGKEDRVRSRKRREFTELIKAGLREEIDSLESARSVSSFNFSVPNTYAYEFDEVERSAVAQEAFNELIEELGPKDCPKPAQKDDSAGG